MTATEPGLARQMWHQLEPVHAVFWYAPQVFAEAAALGYEVQTRWPSYFAWRLAPLRAAGPRLAASACYSFSPDMVAAHVPAAWVVAAPAQILAARERAVDRMYRVLSGDLTRAKRWSRLPPSALPPRKSSPAAAGAHGNGQRPGGYFL